MTSGAGVSSSERLSNRRELQRTTRDAHVALDERIRSSDPFASPASYLAFLRAHQTARDLLDDHFGGLGPNLEWAETSAVDGEDLRNDLIALGGIPGRALPATPTHDSNDGWGLLYVLEGSKLGGSQLANEATRRLGPEAPVSYLVGRSASMGPGRRWRSFCRELETVDMTATMRGAAECAFAVFSGCFVSVAVTRRNAEGSET